MRITIPPFHQARVLVVGDVMLDRYWSGAATRISPEAPVPVVHVTAIEERPGGAANVALNILTLGGQVDLLGLVGQDEAGAALEDLLRRTGIGCHLQRHPHGRTSTKLRILSQHQQLLRADFEGGLTDLNLGLDRDLDRDGTGYAQLARAAAVIVLSDYGKGTLASVGTLIDRARALGKCVIVDPKGTDFSRYRGATLMTPNRAEFEAVVGRCASDEELVERGEHLRRTTALQGLLITRGEQGMTLLWEGQPPLHLPTRAREVYDVTGAGDTVVATLALALAAGAPPPEAVRLANAAAGIVVGKLGTATTTVAELSRALHEPEAGGFGLVSADELASELRQARARGERIVMTNGCFDILHAGHVHYLEQARGLGDRLVVAVNSDASVTALKGPSRPVNRLEHRMAVLAALKSVDWVVPFTEETPERLYCRLLPDVIVKGGDYAPQDIAGGPCVTANGGQVVVLDFLAGVSTTDTIQRLRDGPHE
ncbi:bifunctional D-glycero-beta-D-manno-heptose-7-phosphate kinase/D-glycero-beta-D-manno-heptose 1-phosphate adenylyltransferase HldE [uncultured Thiodictyon sp.]|uniref:bifunctional D-glycero-beta-D-manno-heptose-7-phosphate kinase/D-glycero-beta-D-manno-heptose 1-phosphate adenylyltransferase HldE n=1 Tax=uncultured Thiodictyon sp. TaxID=1846217 RepID=UPI0025F2D5F0|nr:bifunctional D-glycero-beta-D-manno-heptose-7-phosphate kinase/D-glycero-beta-D-manno-heptose 1-phosphate adenylyltransferase HldE [uncultured Thiodictyon sp.]